MPNNSLTISKSNNDICSESKNYQTKLRSRKNSIQSYNDTFINNYYQTKAIKNTTTTITPHIITKTNRIDSVEAITIKVTSENDKVDTTNFVTTEDIISSPVTPTFEEDDEIPTSIFLSPTISKLVNDINNTLYERVTAIKNRNNELNKEILERITKFRNNQHELVLSLINKFDNNNKKTDSSSNSDDNNHPSDTNNDKKEEDNNKNKTEEEKNNLYELLLNIKKENIEFLNTIDTNLIYNINVKYASSNYPSNDQDVIFFTNSNGENKTILCQQKLNEEVFSDDDELNDDDKEKVESKTNQSENMTTVEVNSDYLISPSIERFIICKDNSNVGSNASISSNSPMKRFMKMTGIYKLPYINSNTKYSSSDAELISQSTSKDKKKRISLFKRKESSEYNLKSMNKKQSKNNSSKYLMPSREYNSSVESFNTSSNSLNSLSSLNISKKACSNYELKNYSKEKNKREGKTHKKCHSETLDFKKSNIEIITPLPMSNADSREHKRWSSVPSYSDEEDKKAKNKLKEKEKKKEKERRKEEEKEKKVKEKERKKEEEKEKKLEEKERKLEEKERKLKEKEKKKEEENEKKIKEKEKKKEEENEKKIKEKEKELEKKKKRNNKDNLYKTNSVLEIQRRMKCVFDNYQVKLLGREIGAHPILTHEIANKVL